MCKIQGKIFLTLFATVALTACGVKTDPVAPEAPVDIGRGKPLYKPDTKINKVVPSNPNDPENKNDEEE